MESTLNYKVIVKNPDCKVFVLNSSRVEENGRFFWNPGWRIGDLGAEREGR